MNSYIGYYAQCRQKLNEKIHLIFSECKKIFKHNLKTSKDLLHLIDSKTSIEHKFDQPIEFVNFKFSTNKVKTNMSEDVAFYFVCRYQLVNNLDEIVKEINILFADKQTIVSDCELLVDSFFKNKPIKQEIVVKKERILKKKVINKEIPIVKENTTSPVEMVEISNNLISLDKSSHSSLDINSNNKETTNCDTKQFIPIDKENTTSPVEMVEISNNLISLDKSSHSSLDINSNSNNKETTNCDTKQFIQIVKDNTTSPVEMVEISNNLISLDKSSHSSLDINSNSSNKETTNCDTKQFIQIVKDNTTNPVPSLDINNNKVTTRSDQINQIIREIIDTAEKNESSLNQKTNEHVEIKKEKECNPISSTLEINNAEVTKTTRTTNGVDSNEIMEIEVKEEKLDKPVPIINQITTTPASRKLTLWEEKNLRLKKSLTIYKKAYNEEEAKSNKLKLKYLNNKKTLNELKEELVNVKNANSVKNVILTGKNKEIEKLNKENLKLTNCLKEKDEEKNNIIKKTDDEKTKLTCHSEMIQKDSIELIKKNADLSNQIEVLNQKLLKTAQEIPFIKHHYEKEFSRLKSEKQVIIKELQDQKNLTKELAKKFEEKFKDLENEINLKTNIVNEDKAIIHHLNVANYDTRAKLDTALARVHARETKIKELSTHLKQYAFVSSNHNVNKFS